MASTTANTSTRTLKRPRAYGSGSPEGRCAPKAAPHDPASQGPLEVAVGGHRDRVDLLLVELGLPSECAKPSYASSSGS
jgi:hypothetical protein